MFSCWATRDVVDAGYEERSRDLPGGQGLGNGLDFAEKLVTRQDIDDALLEQRPPHLPPESPQCQAKDPKCRRGTSR